jgi:hypothetical protein
VIWIDRIKVARSTHSGQLHVEFLDVIDDPIQHVGGVGLLQ